MLIISILLAAYVDLCLCLYARENQPLSICINFNRSTQNYQSTTGKRYRKEW